MNSGDGDQDESSSARRELYPESSLSLLSIIAQGDPTTQPPDHGSRNREILRINSARFTFEASEGATKETSTLILQFY
jgi:hypothetical protein